MKRHSILFIAILHLLFIVDATAQPYLDIANVAGNASPNAGLINQNKNEVILDHFTIGTNFPIQCKNKKDAVIVSPFFEKWSSTINNNAREQYYGIGLSVSFLKYIPNSKWRILTSVIVRMNDEKINSKGKMQVGGAFISSYKKNENLTWKFGTYINGDLFGLFIMPLLGIDWNINSKNNLFGLLPGALTYEHKINEHFYYGATYRSITNSYARSAGYWRIDENELGLYLDTYVNKNIVLNLEAGHSILRKIRTGIKDIAVYNAKVNDNFYFKLSMAYRMRFKR